MAIGVTVPHPQQTKDSLTQLLTIGGAAYGGATGGFQGAATGSSLGGVAGGILGPQTQASTPSAIQTGESDALQRRMQALQDSPQMQIANSIDSLKYVQDPQMRSELAKPLLQADYAARNQS